MSTLSHFGSLLDHIVTFVWGETHGIKTHVCIILMLSGSFHPLSLSLSLSHTYFTPRQEERKEREEEEEEKKRGKLRDFLKAIQESIHC